MVTLTVEGQLEQRLRAAAQDANADPRALAMSVLESHLPSHTQAQNPNQATIDLLAEYESEDATTDPAELARRQRDGEAFMAQLARNRKLAEGADARELWK